MIMIKWYDLYIIYHIINKLLYPNCLFELSIFQALNESGEQVGSNQALFKPEISSLKWAEQASRVGWALNEPGSWVLKRADRVGPLTGRAREPPSSYVGRVGYVSLTNRVGFNSNERVSTVPSSSSDRATMGGYRAGPRA